MAKVIDSIVTDRFALYNGDSAAIMPDFPKECVGFSIYSPPFGNERGALYRYSSDPRDLSNCLDYEQFFGHYAVFVEGVHDLTMKGRLSAVHCTDVPCGDGRADLPGDIIRLHEKIGWRYVGRHTIWKEPLWVRNRTMAKDLTHQTVVEDAAEAGLAAADYLLMFRKRGDNPVPIQHPNGLTEYAGECPIPEELRMYKGWTGKQTENLWSHQIWRRYASSIWDDIRMTRVLPYRDCKEPDDEKHVHPMQRDIIARAVALRSNPGETILTPFMGVGSEVFESVRCGRKAIGIELKSSYYRQAVANMVEVDKPDEPEQTDSLFSEIEQ